MDRQTGKLTSDTFIKFYTGCVPHCCFDHDIQFWGLITLLCSDNAWRKLYKDIKETHLTRILFWSNLLRQQLSKDIRNNKEQIERPFPCSRWVKAVRAGENLQILTSNSYWNAVDWVWKNTFLGSLSVRIWIRYVIAITDSSPGGWVQTHVTCVKRTQLNQWRSAWRNQRSRLMVASESHYKSCANES